MLCGLNLRHFVSFLRVIFCGVIGFGLLAGAAMGQEATPIQAEDLSYRKAGNFPRWSEFPTPPKNVPPLSYIKTGVQTAETFAQKQTKQVSVIRWDGADPEKYAQSVRSQLKKKKTDPVDEALSEQEIEAYAEKLRRRGAAPKPYD